MPTSQSKVASRILLVAFCMFSPATAHAQTCGPGSFSSNGGLVSFPPGDAFCGLIADPKEPRSFTSVLRGTSPALDTDIGSVGIGEHLGLVRWGTVQVSLAGAIFSQFDLRTPSHDLINSDFIIGIPISLLIGGTSARARVYHQSSHLGDEYILRDPQIGEERQNLSFLSAQLLLSHHSGNLRFYGGGERFFRRLPGDIAPHLVQFGLEYGRGNLTRIRRLGTVRLVAATDLKIIEEQDWKSGVSARGGIEIGPGPPRETGRNVRILFEYYQGPSPYGQFYRDQVSFHGVGMHLTL